MKTIVTTPGPGVRIVDHTARGTRYLVVATKMPASIFASDNPTWCVSFPIHPKTSYFWQENAALHPGYVHEKWGGYEGDSLEMACAIAMAVPGCSVEGQPSDG
jgi:hypothetical protein